LNNTTCLNMHTTDTCTSKCGKLCEAYLRLAYWPTNASKKS
jgi:hypothetical protein